MRIHRLTALFASLAASATAQNTRDAEFVVQHEAAIQRAAAGDPVAVVASLMAPTGVYLQPFPDLVRGPDGARARLGLDTLASKSTVRWTMLHHGLSADGRDAYSIGYFDLIHPAGDTLPGKFHAYWRRNDQGTWQLLAFLRGRRAPGPVSREFPAALAAIARSSKTAKGDTAVMLKEVFATEGAFADSAAVNVGAAFSGFSAPDVAKLERGSEYVFAPSGVASLFASPQQGNLGPMWKPEVGSIASSGDLAFTLGPAWARVAGPVQTQPPSGGRYFTIWKRQPNGQWRYVVD